MPKIHFKDGRWVDLRLPSVDEYLEILDLPEEETADGRTQRLRFWRDTMRSATRETSWGGPIGSLPIKDLMGLVPQWMSATEDDAVPPASGSSSDMPSPKPPSRRRTAGGRRSSTRASSSP